MSDSQQTERTELLAELFALQATMESALVPELIEPVLSLRLTMQQLKVLTILVIEPDGSTVQTLAKTIDVSLATMSGIVDRLETQGMIARVKDRTDQRVRRVVASSTGRATVQKLSAARPELRRAPLTRLEIDDLRALVRGVRAVALAMETGPSSDDAPR